MKKHIAKQFEAECGAEDFALVPETATDQDRIDREEEERRKTRAEAAKLQTGFNFCPGQ